MEHLFYYLRMILVNKLQENCLSQVEVNDYNVMINGQKFFYKPVKNNLRKYDNIRKITTGQGDDYTTGCLLDYLYFKNYYKIIARA